MTYPIPFANGYNYSWLLLLCFCLIGCKVSLPKDKQTEHLHAVPNITHAINQSVQKKAIFSTGSWPQRQWWALYKAPELNHLIAQSLANNPSIQEIRSRLMIARQEALVTRSNLFPLVFFDAQETNIYLSQNGLYRAFNPTLPLNATLIDLSLSFNYEFDFWGQNRNLFDAALGMAKAQEAETAEVELVISTALSQAYFAYKTNLQRKQLYEELLQVRRNTNQLQSLLVQKGLSSKLPALLSDENVAEAQKWLASINEELSNDQHLINVLAGQGPDSPLAINNTLPPLPQKLQLPRTLSLDLVARRPDLMAQIWRAQAAAYKTGAAMSNFYPNVNLIALLGLESVAWAKLFDPSSGTAASKPAIHLPIFTAGAIRASIRAAKAEFDAAIFAYNNLLLKSTQEILDTLAFAQRVYRQKQEQNLIVKQAQQRYQLTRLRQQKGLDSQFDSYYLHEELIQKKLTNLNLLYNQYLASIKLIKALGGGYYQDKVPLVKRT